MTRPERPFVRVYHDQLQAEFGKVWDDDHLLANWLRLLVVADKLWPAHAEIPRSIKPRHLKGLVESKIVSLHPHDRFEVRGHRKDRAQRAASGRVGSDVKYGLRTDTPPDTEGTPNGLRSETEGGTSRTRTRGGASLPSASEESQRELETPVLVWLASVGAYLAPDGGKLHRNLVMFVERQGADVVLAAMRVRYDAGDRTPSQLIFGAENELEQIHRPDRKAKPKGYQADMAEVEAFTNHKGPLRDIRAKESVR